MMRSILISVSMGFLLAGNAMAETVQYELRIDGISCPSCVATSAKELKKIEGVKKVSSNSKEGIIKICIDDKAVLTDEQLTKLFKEKGFTYRGMKKQDKCDGD